MCGSVLRLSFLLKRIFEKLNQMIWVYSHQSHDWLRVYFVLFSLNSWVPKLVRAVKCFRLLQIHLEELEAGGFNVSYLELLPLDQMLCVLWWWYVYMYKTRFVFRSLCYIIYFIRSAVSCDLRFSSILIFLPSYSSSSNFFLIMVRISVLFGLDV